MLLLLLAPGHIDFVATSAAAFVSQPAKRAYTAPTSDERYRRIGVCIQVRSLSFKFGGDSCIFSVAAVSLGSTGVM